MFLPNSFTLHIRLTKDCNAHCTYCSSAGAHEGRMSPENFKKSINWIAETFFPKLNIGKKHYLTIEYLGGEVLLIPEQELTQNVYYARDVLSPLVHTLKDGVQSNLIGTPRRIDHLIELFNTRIGTSWDPHSGQRHIKGNPQLYQAILDRSITHLKSKNHNPGRVFVVDKHTIPHLIEEIERATKEGYDLVLRPVYEGGSSEIAPASIEDLATAYKMAYEHWKTLQSSVRIEPFSTLLERQKAAQNLLNPIQAAAVSQYCPFQSNCAFKSLSLDPDGTLYICQEMADSGNYPIGNAITGYFDTKTWKRLAERTNHLDNSCKKCPWLKACAGGCMNEAILHHDNPFAKTELCSVWKTVFAQIDTHIEEMKTRKTPHDTLI